MTLHEAELHALYQPAGVDCHAQLFFNPAGDEFECGYPDRDGSAWPYKARAPSFFDVDSQAEMDRLHLWNDYVPPENAPKGRFRRCIVATEDCERFPGAPQDDGTPTTWLWTNPDEPVEDITVTASIGYLKDGGEWVYHFFVENGEVRNV